MSNQFMNARTAIEDILAEKEALLKKAGDQVAKVAISLNSRSITDMNAINNDINKLLNGFTDAEKVTIMRFAIVKIIVNL